MAKLKRPYDPITAEYVERELQKLQAEQELLRQSKGMGGPTDKMPTTGGSGQFGPAEFKYGGKKRKYDGFGETSFLQKPPSMLSSESVIENYNNDYVNRKMQEVHSLYDPDMQDIYKQNDQEVMNKIAAGPNFAKGTLDVSDFGTKPQTKKFDWGEAGVLGAQLAGDIVGLGYSLRKPNYAKYQRISPSLVNYNQAATDITNQAALVENSAAGALRNQGQSSGAYLNNRINLASRLGQQTGAQLASLRMNEANQNVGIKNEALTRNADIQRLETETNTMEKDAKYQALVTHLGGIGSKVVGQDRYNKQLKLDKFQYDNIMKNYPNYFKGSRAIKQPDGSYIIEQN